MYNLKFLWKEIFFGKKIKSKIYMMVLRRIVELEVTIVRNPSLTIQKSSITLKNEEFPSIHDLFNDVSHYFLPSNFRLNAEIPSIPWAILYISCFFFFNLWNFIRKFVSFFIIMETTKHQI